MQTLETKGRGWRASVWSHIDPPLPWIAFLGPDGSGKSSVITGVTDLLKTRGLEIETIHWRPHVLRKSKGGPGTVVTDPHAKPPRHWAVSLVKLVELLLDWWLAWPWILRRPRAAGHLLVSDRYYADLLVDPRRYRFAGLAGLARFSFRFLPKPDRVIILVGDPAQIHARKREVTVEEMERQVAAYRTLGAALGEKAIVLETSVPLEEVIAAAHTEVIRALNAKSRNEAATPP